MRFGNYWKVSAHKKSVIPSPIPNSPLKSPLGVSMSGYEVEIMEQHSKDIAKNMRLRIRRFLRMKNAPKNRIGKYSSTDILQLTPFH